MSSPGQTEKYIIRRTKGGPICAALIDPEDFSPKQAGEVARRSIKSGVELIMVGGSTISSQRRLDAVVKSVKNHVSVPVILFPGNVTGVSRNADAILFSSLLNSTNPYFLIGAQALGAMEVHRAGLEAIPMGYLVFGNSSSTSFIGQVNSLPPSKPQLALIYAMAAGYLGMRSLYLEAGSGASEPVSDQTISLVRRFYNGVLIVGGGITTARAATAAAKAGADIIVIGNLLTRPNYAEELRKIVSATKAATETRA